MTLRLPSFDVPTSACPHCGKAADRASPTTGLRGPDEGDASFCTGCGCWSIFTALRTRRLPTSEEAERIAVDPESRRVERAWWSL